MHYRAGQIFYALSIFVLMTAIFVIRPSRSPEVANLQSDMQQKFSVAWEQTMGDASYFGGLEIVYDGVTDFYNQAASSTIALLSQPEQDEQMYLAFNSVYHFALDAFVNPDETLAMNNETQVLTHKLQPVVLPQGQVSGASTQGIPLNKSNSWVTIADNTTGQLYCLAIYNGEVNKYLGRCPDEVSDSGTQATGPVVAPESGWSASNKHQIPKASSF